MTLTTAQLDRACGVLLGTAAGDALGAAYEFGPPRGPQLEVAMVGGGSFGWEPGEWTDDTSMAIAIAEVAATGADLREEAGARRHGPAVACVVAARQRCWRADPVSPQPSGPTRHFGADGTCRVGGAARTHWPHRGQRLADADCATGTGLPRRRARSGGGGPCGQRADPLRPRGR